MSVISEPLNLGLSGQASGPAQYLDVPTPPDTPANRTSASRDHDGNRAQQRASAVRALLVGVLVFLAFVSVAVQLVRLAAQGQAETVKVAAASPLASAFARPDIVDRKGVLLATDVAVPSLYADPKNLLSVDETLEALQPFLPSVDTPDMRRLLEDRSRRFVWLQRKLPTELAEKIHHLGIPGIGFRDEPARSYPRGRLAGHVLGHVNIDNVGLDGIERAINDRGVYVQTPVTPSAHTAVHLSLDAAAQFGLEKELQTAMQKYRTEAASGIIIDVETGAVAAAASLPGVDPMRPRELMDTTRRDRLLGDAFELGSVFKILTLAQAMDVGLANPKTKIDVAKPLRVGRFSVRDLHPVKPALTVTEVFVLSSNVGSGVLARRIGATRQQEFFRALGLLKPLRTEAGQTPQPIVPSHWGKAENITTSYGHGIAVSPVQFAAAAAAMVNGGVWHAPSFFSNATTRSPLVLETYRVIQPQTSKRIRKMMRKNVRTGTGKRAHVEGYDVGGKTGTADWVTNGAYDGSRVITSFVAAFPMYAPRYLVMVTLFDPKPVARGRSRTASQNAAPLAGRVIARVAPLLGVVPVSN